MHPVRTRCRAGLAVKNSSSISVTALKLYRCEVCACANEVCVFHLCKEQLRCVCSHTNTSLLWPTKGTYREREVVPISNFTTSGEPIVYTVAVCCPSQHSSTACCQENEKIINYNPLHECFSFKHQTTCPIHT